MLVDFMVSHCWGSWRQLCALCFFTSRAALRRPRRRPSARLPDSPPRWIPCPLRVDAFSTASVNRVISGTLDGGPLSADSVEKLKMELWQKFATDPSRPVFGNRMPCSRATRRAGWKSAVVMWALTYCIPLERSECRPQSNHRDEPENSTDDRNHDDVQIAFSMGRSA
jgi:hypothetical protein